MTEIQQAPAPQPTSVPVTLVSTGNGLGVTSLIIGIIAFSGAFIPVLNVGAGLLAIVGLVFGFVALTRKGKTKGTAIAGLITSAIASILSIILVIVYTAGFVAAVDSSLPQTSTQDSVEAEAEPEVVAEPAVAELGTRENPAPIGTVIETTSGGAVDYEIMLGAPTLDANAAVAAANQFNEAAPTGFQYAMVPVTFTYKGAETGTPWIDVVVEFVSAAARPTPATRSSADLHPP